MRIRLEHGSLDLDAGVLIRDGQRSPLRPMEVALLRYLAARPDTPAAQDELLREVWGYAAAARSRTVRSTVSRLRKRIEPDPENPTHLLTRVGEGYLLRPAMAPTSPRLVGRDADEQALREALDRHGAVNLVGPGGVGKTALARRLAEEVTDAVWIDARSATDADELATLAAADLGCRVDALPVRFRAATLVVVDDLQPHLGPTVTAWRQGPESWLFTTRVRLDPPPLATYELAPLSDEAMRALLEGIWSKSSLTDEANVGPLLGALGGLPLAAHLTAPWAALMTPAALASRLANRPLEALGRVLDESLKLLSAQERAALTQLAVCPGGLRVDDAEHLLMIDALPSLLALRRHSLVQRAPNDRIELLPPVRDHVIRTQPTDEATRRLSPWFAQYAQSILVQLETPEDGLAWHRLRAEAANLRAAAHAGTNPEGQRCLLQALDHLYRRTGALEQHRELLADDAHLDATGQAWLRIARARLTRLSGDLARAVDEARLALDRAGPFTSSAADELARCLVYRGQSADAVEPATLALHRARTDVERTEALLGLAALARVMGRGPEALDYSERATSAAATGPTALLARARAELAEHLGRTDYARSQSLFAQALAVQAALGLHHDRAATLLRRGGVHLDRTDAIADYQRALELGTEHHLVRVVAHASLRLAQSAMEAERTDLEPELTAAIRQAALSHDPNLQASLLVNRGHMRVDMGQHTAAEADYQRAIALAEGLGMPLYEGAALLMAGMGAAAMGQTELGIQRLERARTCWADYPPGLPQVDCLIGLLTGQAPPPDLPEPELDWMRWAVLGGPEPTAPRPEESWIARQIQRGGLAPPTG